MSHLFRFKDEEYTLEQLEAQVQKNDKKMYDFFNQYSKEGVSSIKPVVMRTVDDFIQKYANFEGIEMLLERNFEKLKGLRKVIILFSKKLNWFSHFVNKKEKYEAEAKELLLHWCGKDNLAFVSMLPGDENTIYMNTQNIANLQKPMEEVKQDLEKIKGNDEKDVMKIFAISGLESQIRKAKAPFVIALHERAHHYISVAGNDNYESSLQSKTLEEGVVILNILALKD
jgi:hypothetical protein